MARASCRCLASSCSSRATRPRARVIGDAPVRVAVEAGVRQGWDAIIGIEGAFIGMHGFGASGKYKEVYAHFGITAEKVAAAALKKLAARR